MEEAPSVELPRLGGKENSLPEARNTVLLCALSGRKLALECIDKIIDIARPAGFPISDTVQVESTPRWRRLITKYYSALLNLKTFDVSGIEEHFGEFGESYQVMIVVISAEDESKLRPLLSQLSRKDVELSMVIRKTGSTSLETNSEFWEEICGPFGFEYYDYDDLAEASMALQCVRWSNLQRHRSTELPAFGTSLADTPAPLTAGNTSQIPHIPSTEQASSPSTDRSYESTFDPPHFSSSAHNDQPSIEESSFPSQFHDDFSPFVSAEPGSTSSLSLDSTDPEDFLPTVSQLEEIQDLIFGKRQSSHCLNVSENPSEGENRLFDLEDMLVRLESLKASAQQMNDDERKTFAAGVALVVERSLDRN